MSKVMRNILVREGAYFFNFVLVRGLESVDRGSDSEALADIDNT